MPPPLSSLLHAGRHGAAAASAVRYCSSRRSLCASAAAVTGGCPRLTTRPATPADLPALRRLQPDAHGGLDDLEQQLLRQLASPATTTMGTAVGGFPRHAYVAELADNDVRGIAAFLNVVLVDAGESAVLTHGRTRADLVGTGILAQLVSAALTDLSSRDGRRRLIARSLGALCMPRYTRQLLAERADAFTVLDSLGQLGFHFNSLYYRAELAPRLAAAATPDDGRQLWQLLADRPDTRERLFPSGHVMVGRLPMRLTEGNLEMAGSDPVLGPGARPNVIVGGGVDSGVSFRCQHRASLGRHLTVTSYADTEEAVVAHLVRQMQLAASQPGPLMSPTASDAAADDDDEDIYVSLFFPAALSLPRLLNLLHADPTLHNLPLSCNPKLNCKLHAVEHRYTAGFALASPEHAIPDDVTNIDHD